MIRNGLLVVLSLFCLSAASQETGEKAAMPVLFQRGDSGKLLDWTMRIPGTVTLGKSADEVNITPGPSGKILLLRHLFKKEVFPTRTYILSYADCGDHGRFRVYVEWDETYQQKRRLNAAGIKFLSPSESWSTHQFTFSPPADASQCYVVIQFENGKRLQIKNITLREIVDVAGPLGGKWRPDSNATLLPKCNGIKLANDGKATLTHVPVQAGTKYRLTYMAIGQVNAKELLPMVMIRSEVSPVRDGRFAYHDVMNTAQRKFHEFKVAGDTRTVDIAFHAGLTGTVEITNLKLKEVVENSRSQWRLELHKPFYRNTLFAGDPEMLAGIITADREAGSAHLYLKDEPARSVTVKLQDGKGTFQLPVPGLSLGEHILTASILSKNQKELGILSSPVYKVPPGSREIKATEKRLLQINGKPFFPIAIWKFTPSEKFFYYAARHGVNMSTFQPGQTTRETIDILNQAHRYGIKLMLDVEYLQSEKDLPYFCARLRSLIGPELLAHPAFLGYLMADESLWGGRSPQLMDQGYQFIKKLDPYHPVWVNAAPRYEVNDHRPFAQASDIYGCDIYPVPYPNGHSGLADKYLTAVGKYAQRMNEVGNFRKPIWMVLQGFNWGEAPENPPDAPMRPYPTLTESRFMAFDALLNGGTGYVLWGTDLVRSPQFVETLFAVTTELHTLSGLWVSGTQGKDRPTASPALRCAVLTDNGKDYFFLMNRTPKPVSGTIELGISGDTVTVYGNHSTLPVSSGRLKVNLKPYEVIVCGAHDLPEPAWKLPPARPDWDAEGSPFFLAIQEYCRQLSQPHYQGKANWIWEKSTVQQSDGQCLLGKEFELAAIPARADLLVAADNTVDIYLNGHYVARQGNWKIMKSFDLRQFLRPGKNILLLVATNIGLSPCGILAELHLGAQTYVSDSSWQAVAVPKGASAPQNMSLKNSSSAVVIAPYGGGAWRRKVVIDEARKP